jgi:hypothetical protein
MPTQDINEEEGEDSESLMRTETSETRDGSDETDGNPVRAGEFGVGPQ